jgi:hypothetical protein
MAQPPFAGGCDSLLQSGSAVVVVEARRSCGGRGNRPPRWSLAGMISGFLGESPPMVDMRRREVITLLAARQWRGAHAAAGETPWHRNSLAKPPGCEIPPGLLANRRQDERVRRHEFITLLGPLPHELERLISRSLR